MEKINLLRYHSAVKIIQRKGKKYIYDPIRKKYLVLQPEEFVRQLVLHHLIHHCKYNPHRISVEKSVQVVAFNRRCDILVYDLQLRPWLLIECKAPEVAISQAVFDQIVQYNMPLGVEYLMLTNGIRNFGCTIDHQHQCFNYLDTLPPYPS